MRHATLAGDPAGLGSAWDSLSMIVKSVIMARDIAVGLTHCPSAVKRRQIARTQGESPMVRKILNSCALSGLSLACTVRKFHA